MNIENFKDKIPVYVKNIGSKLIENGYEAYLVGGCVRDTLLEKSPKDWDIATNATPDKIVEIFPRSILIGARFGTVTVLEEDNNNETFQVEITTYRIEEDYVGGRWPEKVEFASNIEDDLSRRDLTINAFAYNLHSDTNELLDFHGGLIDLEQKIIRAVGNPIDRFSEDGLRAFRACRFASTLQYEIDKNTFDAIKETLTVSKMVSVERIQSEFTRLLIESPKPSYGIELLRESGLLSLFLPELLEGYGVDQNDYHHDDVYWHSLHCADIAPDKIKLAALFHDIGKPRKKDGPHFYGHDIEGAEMTKVIMKRLKFSNDEIDRISNLIRWHMFYYPFSKEETEDGKIVERTEMMNKGWTDHAVRRFIRNVGGQDAVNELFMLRIADATCNKKSAWDPEEIDALQLRISKVLQEDIALKVTDLDISGTDIMELGVKQGPDIKAVLNFLLEKVEENPLNNDKIVLQEIAKDYIKSMTE
ncbi:MAG: HD domain-containing protein [bacterium]